jgi:hypothetical protein
MYIFNVTDSTGAVSGYPSVRVYDNKGRLKTIGGGTPPPPAPVVWGTITGIVTNQTDLITYLSGNYYPLSSNPAGYLTQVLADGLYYPLSSNPAGYLTQTAADLLYYPISSNPAGYLTDAPSDGSTYGRNNGAWTIVSGSGTLVALPFTTDHITANGNPYVVGDVVYYIGNVYRCIANNDSILPTNASYWISLGAGFPLVQQPSDWNSTSGNNQILNKPTISTYTVDNGLTENPTGNFQLGGTLIQDTAIDGVGSGTWMLDFVNLHSSTNTARYLYSFATNHGGSNTLLSLDSNSNVSRFSHEDGGTTTVSAIELTGTELRVQTPAYATATNGDVLTLMDNTTGEAEWQTPTSGGGILHGTATGTDTYAVTITGATAYADGDAYLIRFTNGNTTGATLNINGQGAIPLYRNNDGALIGGDIIDGGEMLCVYNSTTNRFQVIGTAPNTLLGYVTNGESITITKGQAVYAFSGTGDRMVVKLANNIGDATSAQTVGLVLSTSIAANQKGLIMLQGLLDGLNILPTSTYNDGDPIFLGPTAGSITKTKPYAPNHLVYLGVVTTASNGNAGRMYVKVQNGYELDELHNVQAQSPTVNDVLYFFGGSPGQWKTASISTILGYTPQAQLNGTGFVVASGTTISYDNTAYAPLASPAFTGTPTAPTAASGTNTTQIATTAFVQTAVQQSSSLVGMFGDGLSGNATITGPLSLSNDAYYNDLTISGAGSIFLNGFRLFVKGTLDISNAGANAIYNNGFLGDGATGVTAGNNTAGSTLGRGGYGQTTSGWHSGGTGSNVAYRGGNGGGGASINTNNAGAGVQSPASTLAVSGGTGGTGGKGGNSTIGTGGNGGAGQTTGASPAVVYVRTLVNDLGRIQTIRQSTSATTITTVAAAGAYHGGGGGGGGSSTAGNGGGGSAGGGGGGNTIVYARQIVVGAGTNASAIAARGGDGGSSTYTPTTNIGGGGGGAGGGGGYIYLVYGTITGGTYTFASANGGTGGNGGNGNGTGLGGQGGAGGSGGRITAISLGNNTITVVDGTGNLGTVPAIPATTTGSAGGAGGTCTFSS